METFIFLLCVGRFGLQLKTQFIDFSGKRLNLSSERFDLISQSFKLLVLFLLSRVASIFFFPNTLTSLLIMRRIKLCWNIIRTHSIWTMLLRLRISIPDGSKRSNPKLRTTRRPGSTAHLFTIFKSEISGRSTSKPA